MVLETKYHSQRNNKLFPYSSCGTTVVAEYLSYINSKFSKSYVSDDDQVFAALSSKDMKKKAQEYIDKGDTWMKDFLKYRKEPDGTADEYNYLNNVFIMLAEVASYLTNYEYNFVLESRTFDEIKNSINNGMPVIISGLFTKSGHYVLIVGYNDVGFIVDDPYGDWKSEYKNQDGNKMIYYYKDIKSILNLNNGKDAYLTISVK